MKLGVHLSIKVIKKKENNTFENYNITFYGLQN